MSILEEIIAAFHGLEAWMSPDGPPTPDKVAAALDKRAGVADDHLDWRGSIVDLLKVLELDSSIAARRKLAVELGHTGKFGNTADLNVWLHEAVLKKVAEHGIPVPST